MTSAIVSFRGDGYSTDCIEQINIGEPTLGTINQINSIYSKDLPKLITFLNARIIECSNLSDHHSKRANLFFKVALIAGVAFPLLASIFYFVLPIPITALAIVISTLTMEGVILSKAIYHRFHNKHFRNMTKNYCAMNSAAINSECNKKVQDRVNAAINYNAAYETAKKITSKLFYGSIFSSLGVTIFVGAFTKIPLVSLGAAGFVLGLGASLFSVMISLEEKTKDTYEY